MYLEILDKIKKYNKIIISRHHRPDLDALGSQLGLASLIKDNFKDKSVYVVGDMSKPSFLGQMDTIEDSEYNDALIIYTDVSTMNMIANLPINLAKEIICIDHHRNVCDIENATAYYDVKAAAAAQMIAEFAFMNNLFISERTFTCLFAGIISDTNRFNFSLTEKLFDTMSKLIALGYDYSSIYNTMYSDKVSSVKMRAYFTEKFIVNEFGLAYMINDKSVFEKFPVDLFTISRGMVNVMANLEGVHVWANFTQDPKTNKISCEFRSKKIIILPVAIKYGGGGHSLACGATVDNFDIVKDIINDFNELIKEH